MQIAKNGGLPFKKTAMYSTVRNHFSELVESKILQRLNFSVWICSFVKQMTPENWVCVTIPSTGR
jgi:hypothetical protein